MFSCLALSVMILLSSLSVLIGMYVRGANYTWVDFFITLLLFSLDSCVVKIEYDGDYGGSKVWLFQIIGKVQSGIQERFQ